MARKADGKTSAAKKAPSTDKSIAATKRSAAKAPSSKRKASPTKRATKPQTARERMEDELVRMIPEIDTDGLLFLVRQANVLLHNKRVDELNAEMEKRAADQKQKHKKAGTTARVGQTVEEITVEIQRSPDGKTYYMIIDEQKHFFTAEEMAAIVKLCFQPKRKSDALRFLYQYMYNERGEVLMDHHISAEKHPFFEALFYEVRAKFTLDD